MRLTIDIDNRSRKWIIQKKLRLIKKMFPSHKIEYEDSASKKGGHIIVHSAAKNWDDIIAMRLILGDDIRRIEKDASRMKKGIACSILFDKKNNQYATSFFI